MRYRRESRKCANSKHFLRGARKEKPITRKQIRPLQKLVAKHTRSKKSQVKRKPRNEYIRKLKSKSGNEYTRKNPSQQSRRKKYARKISTGKRCISRRVAKNTSTRAKRLKTAYCRKSKQQQSKRSRCKSKRRYTKKKTGVGDKKTEPIFTQEPKRISLKSGKKMVVKEKIRLSNRRLVRKISLKVRKKIRPVDKKGENDKKKGGEGNQKNKKDRNKRKKIKKREDFILPFSIFTTRK